LSFFVTVTRGAIT